MLLKNSCTLGHCSPCYQNLYTSRISNNIITFEKTMGLIKMRKEKEKKFPNPNLHEQTYICLTSITYTKVPKRKKNTRSSIQI